MSFSRAKIIRFNEAKAITPSPVPYDQGPKRSAIRSISVKNNQLDKSFDQSDNESIHSANTAPCFRTPTLINKKKLPLSAQKPVQFKPNKKLFQDATSEELQDKIVECKNKDAYIRDLTEQIDELCQKLYNTKLQHDQLTLDKAKFDKYIVELGDEHKISLQTIYLEHDIELSKLKTELNNEAREAIKIHEDYCNLKNKLETAQEMHDTLTEELQNKHKEEVEELHKRINLTELNIQNKEKEITDLLQNIIDIQGQHQNEIDKLSKTHNERIRKLELDMLENITKIQNELDKEKNVFEIKLKEIEEQKLKEISDIKESLEKENVEILQLSEAKIKHITENSNEAVVLAEIQMQETYKDIELSWKLKLENQTKESDAILKECQAISEYNIIQSEVEKNKFRTELSAKLEEIKQLELEKNEIITNCNVLQTKLNLSQIEFTEKIKLIENEKQKIEDEIKDKRNDLEKALKDKKAYQISVNNIYSSLDALSKRLLSSDQDVEQLKAELESCELSKLEAEGKCNQLSEELGLVSKLNEDLELQHEQLLEMAQERCADIEKNLLKKVDDLKSLGMNEIRALKDVLISKDEDLKECREQLYSQQKLNTQAQILIDTARMELDRLEAINTDLEYKYSALQGSFDCLQTELKGTRKTITNIKDKNNELLRKVDEIVDENKTLLKTNEEINLKLRDLETIKIQFTQLQMQSDNYSKYCDYYKTKSEEYENEVTELRGVNKNYITQCGKYDELLQKYERMQTDYKILESKVQDQEKLISPFHDELETYKQKYLNARHQQKEQELEERTLGPKCAEMMDYQNHKQKVKHLVELKTKYFDVISEKSDLEQKCFSQKKQIDKLKRELTIANTPRKLKVPTNEKENINSPSKSKENRIDSPNTVLRERN